MFVPFESLPSESRIWIFQANRPFTAAEMETVESRLRQFTGEWAVHGTPLNTSFLVRYNQFIILAADESEYSASGCSIDSSVRAIKELGQTLGVDLFDRSQIAFMSNDKISLAPLQELKQKFQSGMLSEETLTFNNLVKTRSEFEKLWLVPASATWLKRYIPNPLEKVK